jgi:hypothetical protein
MRCRGNRVSAITSLARGWHGGARRSCGGGYKQGQLSLVGGREHDGTRARVGRALSDIARCRRGLLEQVRTERDVAAESRYPAPGSGVGRGTTRLRGRHEPRRGGRRIAGAASPNQCGTRPRTDELGGKGLSGRGARVRRRSRLAVRGLPGRGQAADRPGPPALTAAALNVFGGGDGSVGVDRQVVRVREHRGADQDTPTYRPSTTAPSSSACRRRGPRHPTPGQRQQRSGGATSPVLSLDASRDGQLDPGLKVPREAGRRPSACWAPPAARRAATPRPTEATTRPVHPADQTRQLAKPMQEPTRRVGDQNQTEQPHRRPSRPRIRGARSVAQPTHT